MDTSVHQTLYAQGLEMRKKVVGEDYVANALEKGGSDFMKPLQQFATVRFLCISSTSLNIPPFKFLYIINNPPLPMQRSSLNQDLC